MELVLGRFSCFYLEIQTSLSVAPNSQFVRIQVKNVNILAKRAHLLGPILNHDEDFTVRNEVAKIMLLHLSVCSQGGLPQCMLGYHPPEQTPTPPPTKTATAVDGTHPTGMHSCLYFFRRRWVKLRRGSWMRRTTGRATASL